MACFKNRVSNHRQSWRHEEGPWEGPWSQIWLRLSDATNINNIVYIDFSDKRGLASQRAGVHQGQRRHEKASPYRIWQSCPGDCQKISFPLH